MAPGARWWRGLHHSLGLEPEWGWPQKRGSLGPGQRQQTHLYSAAQEIKAISRSQLHRMVLDGYQQSS
ncbi:unnamed protein product [Arctogadus glacialis]